MTRVEMLQRAYTDSLITEEQLEEFLEAEFEGRSWAPPFAVTLAYTPKPVNTPLNGPRNAVFYALVKRYMSLRRRT